MTRHILVEIEVTDDGRLDDPKFLSADITAALESHDYQFADDDSTPAYGKARVLTEDEPV